MNDAFDVAGAARGGPARLIKIDTEHFAIRLLLPVLTFGLVLLVHFGGQWLVKTQLDGVSWLCLVLPADILALFGGSMLLERALKMLLPSKRSALLTGDELVITDARQDPPDVTRIAWDSAVNIKAWRFKVQRRGSRVPRGWYCMALYLLQDEEDTIFYTFMPQAEAEALAGYENFTWLRPRKETESNTDLSAVAEQRRLLKLEDRRWEDGAEVSREDFQALDAALVRHVPGWAGGARPA